MNQKGISLMELSFVAGISVILGGLVAGAGAYLSNQSAGHAIVEDAKRFDRAIQEYMLKASNGGAAVPWPTVAVAGDPLMNVLKPFIDKEDYQMPYQGFGTYVVGFPAFAAGYVANFGDANYPKTTYAGRIVYLYNAQAGSAYGTTTFAVYDGASARTVRQYALQALNDQGWPLATVSH